MTIDKSRIMEALRAEDVADYLGIKGHWYGRWLRSCTCPVTRHPNEAFALSRDGKMHCHACDFGGGLLDAIALGSGLGTHDGRVSISDFPKVIEIAAGIAGVADDFGIVERPSRVERPPPPPQLPLGKRLALARERAAWIWGRLFRSDEGSVISMYLRLRGLDPEHVLRREELRATPIRMPPALLEKIRSSSDGHQDLRSVWRTMGTRPGTTSVVIPVRHVADGSFVDLRQRRVAPEEDQPKIIGMLGGITAIPAERGNTRQLVGCFGNPHAVDDRDAIVVEGGPDYLTALAMFPNMQVFGAVEAGTMSLVVRHVAKALAFCDPRSKLAIVEQNDPPRILSNGKVVPGAADQAINESPTAAAKTAMGLLGASRVGWLFCDDDHCEAAGGTRGIDGKPIKDLNDCVRAGADVNRMLVWWSEAR